MDATVLAWPHRPAPGIDHHNLPPHVTRALLEACRDLDRDIERVGAATEVTINKVRAALELARTT